jgi:hypothetical protein
LLIRMPYEGRPVVLFDASSWEDEQRLRCWLHGLIPLGALADALLALLEELRPEDEDAEAA